MSRYAVTVNRRDSNSVACNFPTTAAASQFATWLEAEGIAAFEAYRERLLPTRPITHSDFSFNLGRVWNKVFGT